MRRLDDIPGRYFTRNISVLRRWIFQAFKAFLPRRSRLVSLSLSFSLSLSLERKCFRERREIKLRGFRALRKLHLERRLKVKIGLLRASRVVLLDLKVQKIENWIVVRISLYTLSVVYKWMRIKLHPREFTFNRIYFLVQFGYDIDILLLVSE